MRSRPIAGGRCNDKGFGPSEPPSLRERFGRALSGLVSIGCDRQGRDAAQHGKRRERPRAATCPDRAQATLINSDAGFGTFTEDQARRGLVEFRQHHCSTLGTTRDGFALAVPQPVGAVWSQVNVDESALLASAGISERAQQCGMMLDLTDRKFSKGTRSA